MKILKSSQMEVWKPIRGFKGHYEISNHGRVKSLSRKIKHSRSIFLTMKERILKQSVTRNGKPHYAHVILSLNGKHTTGHIHQLAAKTFIGKRPYGCEVMHKDGNLLNNHVSNLIYGTRKDNMAMAIEHGTTTRGIKNPMAKLTNNNVNRVKRLYKKGMFQREIGDVFGVSQSCISSILKGKSWAWL